MGLDRPALRLATNMVLVSHPAWHICLKLVVAYGPHLAANGHTTRPVPSRALMLRRHGVLGSCAYMRGQFP